MSETSAVRRQDFVDEDLARRTAAAATGNRLSRS
jgi:hypothetical protein